jgi:hypothetical protein
LCLPGCVFAAEELWVLQVLLEVVLLSHTKNDTLWVQLTVRRSAQLVRDTSASLRAL